MTRLDKLRFDLWSRFDTQQDVVQGIDDWTRPDGTPIFQPVSDRHPGWQRFTNWYDLGPWGKQLRGKHTKVVYVSPDGGRLWNLAGDWAGKEGVVLAPNLQGSMHMPFDQRYSAGAYQIGEDLERTDYRKRVFNLGVIIGPHINFLSRKRFPDNEFAYRMLEEKWWSDWPEHHRAPAGYWGECTRTHGWRWIRVRQGEANDQSLELDPVAFGNNSQSWAMTIHAQFPFYSKRPFTKVWANDAANAQLNGRNNGVLYLPNRGDWDQWPKFIVEGFSKGGDTVTIQDGITDRMVELPEFFDTDGMVLVDTDPSKRTLTASTDAVDTWYYKLIRSSEVLDYILGDISNADSGVPVGRRMPGGIGFASQLPKKESTSIRVTHTNPNGKITAIVPQWYKMGFS
jgi:hypothetical protein